MTMTRTELELRNRLDAVTISCETLVAANKDKFGTDNEHEHQRFYTGCKKYAIITSRALKF